MGDYNLGSPPLRGLCEIALARPAVTTFLLAPGSSIGGCYSSLLGISSPPPTSAPGIWSGPGYLHMQSHFPDHWLSGDYFPPVCLILQIW